jgi:hypothetical protein
MCGSDLAGAGDGAINDRATGATTMISYDTLLDESSSRRA